MTKIKHLYIHIPISKSNCKICDSNKVIDFSLKQILNEINDDRLDEKLKTLYIGGLNAGELGINSLKMLFLAISKRFLSIDELTFETYSQSVTSAKIEILKKYNVNRIVLKVKTFNDALLSKWSMKNQTQKAFELLRQNGFKNISIDMNFGLGKRRLKKDLDEVLKLNPEAIHWYSHDIWGDGEELKFIANMMELFSYNRYEMTGFAKKGFESQHSIAYWTSKNWLGIGEDASSFVDKFYNGIELQETDLARHVIMMALEYEKGLDLSNPLHNFAYKYFKDELDFQISDNTLNRQGNNIIMNPDDWEVLDRLLEAIF